MGRGRNRRVCSPNMVMLEILVERYTPSLEVNKENLEQNTTRPCSTRRLFLGNVFHVFSTDMF
jgi:hypothetical protein